MKEQSGARPSCIIAAIGCSIQSNVLAYSFQACHVAMAMMSDIKSVMEQDREAWRYELSYEEA